MKRRDRYGPSLKRSQNFSIHCNAYLASSAHTGDGPVAINDQFAVFPLFSCHFPASCLLNSLSRHGGELLHATLLVQLRPSCLLRAHRQTNPVFTCMTQKRRLPTISRGMAGTATVVGWYGRNQSAVSTLQ